MSANGCVDADAARLRYTGVRNKVKTMIGQTKRKFEKDVALKSKSNLKAFWSHIRRRLKTKTGVVPLLENDNDRIYRSSATQTKLTFFKTNFRVALHGN